MITPNMPRNVSFRVETLFSKTKGRVGVIRPNDLGIYCGVPMMVMGEITQQKTYYDPVSMMEQITNPATGFHKEFTAQKKCGEWGHPQFYGLRDEDKLARLTKVEEDRTSHLFTGLYTDNPSPDGTVVVRADIKPTGKYGHLLKDSLDDPVMNTAFSLRAFVSTNVRPDGVKFRTVRQLTTWDCVNSSGYATTDKNHALGLESFSGDDYSEYEINVLENGNLVIDQIALESFVDTDLNEILGIQHLGQVVQSRTFVESDRDLQSRFPGLYNTSVFQDFFKEGR